MKSFEKISTLSKVVSQKLESVYDSKSNIYTIWTILDGGRAKKLFSGSYKEILAFLVGYKCCLELE